MGRRRRKAARDDWFTVIFFFLGKLAWCGAKRIFFIAQALIVVLFWLIARPVVAISALCLQEFVLLPWRIMELCAKVGPALVRMFDDVKLDKKPVIHSAPVTFVPKKKKKPSITARLFTKTAKLPPPVGVIIQENKPKQAKSVKPGTADCERLGRLLEEKLECFGVKGKVTSIHPGPVITQFEYRPGVDVKISKILSLEDDLAMALTAVSVRILAPIPGKNAVGFEIAHASPSTVHFDELLQSSLWQDCQTNVPIVLGVDGIGNPVIEDLVRMPHLLIAGSTGSGKSVCMHSILASILMSKGPDDLKLILIDPKRLEFSPYVDIPHLLFPVVNDISKAAIALKWVVVEMERRYEIIAKSGARNIEEYQSLQRAGKGQSGDSMPFLVLMIDELADLMMVGGREIEGSLVRIAQMARAAGIHLVVATQRPSVDVVTGLIKVNFPSRIAFRVSSRIDSRTILDASGAEKLMGRGDMLFLHPSVPFLRRVHGAFITGSQVDSLATYLRSAGKPDYVDLSASETLTAASRGQEKDSLYDEAVEFARSRDELSISMLQRRLRIGFNRSARLIEQLEDAGILAPAQGSKPRKVV